jgi:hypothetical protein
MTGAMAAFGAIAVIVFLFVIAMRRRLGSDDRGLGYVSQSWLAELRATEGSLGT